MQSNGDSERALRKAAEALEPHLRQLVSARLKDLERAWRDAAGDDIYVSITYRCTAMGDWWFGVIVTMGGMGYERERVCHSLEDALRELPGFVRDVRRGQARLDVQEVRVET